MLVVKVVVVTATVVAVLLNVPQLFSHIVHILNIINSLVAQCCSCLFPRPSLARWPGRKETRTGVSAFLFCGTPDAFLFSEAANKWLVYSCSILSF